MLYFVYYLLDKDGRDLGFSCTSILIYPHLFYYNLNAVNGVGPKSQTQGCSLWKYIFAQTGCKYRSRLDILFLHCAASVKGFCWLRIYQQVKLAVTGHDAPLIVLQDVYSPRLNVLLGFRSRLINRASDAWHCLKLRSRRTTVSILTHGMSILLALWSSMIMCSFFLFVMTPNYCKFPKGWCAVQDA